MKEALNRALDITLEKEYELRKIGQSHMIEPVILAIKEALAQSASYKQSTTCGEPVAWDGDCVLGHCGSPAGCEASNCCRADSTTPPQHSAIARKPLTIDQIASIAIDRSKPDGIIAFVRAIEAAHGIKE